MLPGPSMPPDNSEQIAEWNGALGQRWVAMQREIDRIVSAVRRCRAEVCSATTGRAGDRHRLRLRRHLARRSHESSARRARSLASTCRRRCLRLLARVRVLADCAHLVFRERRCLGGRTSSKHRFAVLAFRRNVFQPTHASLRATCAGRCARVAVACSSAGGRRVTTRGRWRPLRRARGDGCHASARGSERARVRSHSPTSKALRAILSGAGFGADGCAALRRGGLPWRDAALAAADFACRLGRYPAWCARWALSTFPIIRGRC